MKLRTLFWLVAILLSACTSHNKNKVIFIPDPMQDKPQEQTEAHETWQIIESQNGSGETEIPAWVLLYLTQGVRNVEGMDEYRGKYVFIGENRGDNLKTLQQWVNGFSAVQDLPRLIAQRMEQRFTASTALYPDDEYGEYFANMIKKAWDAEYPGAQKEQSFWVKRQRNIEEDIENYAGDFTIPQIDTDFERYEYLVLISIDKVLLQRTIQEIMANTKSNTSPTKDQAAAINKIRATFFEGF